MTPSHVGKRWLLPDTHAHLDAKVFATDLDEVLDRAVGAGVYRVLAVGSDLASSMAAISLAQRYSAVYAAVGMHPHEAERFEEEAIELEDLLGCAKVVAVGEIGLDYYRSGADRQVQLEAFRQQVGWARKRSLPISVHNRAADEDVLMVLADTGANAVLHCFSGDWPLASAALAAGHYLSFAGNLTFPKATALRGVAERVPLDRVLLETDSPVLAPQHQRGRRNEPAYLTETLLALASARGENPDHLAEHLVTNADCLFRWGIQ